jgi:hypothetical protein
MFRNELPIFFFLNGLERNSECSSVKWFGIEFRAFLSSAEKFGTKLRSSEYFSLLRNVSERNSEHFYLPRNGSDQFWEFFSSTKWFRKESRAFLSSAEWLGTEFRAFFVPRNGQNSDGMNQNLRLFRVPRIYFQKMTTLDPTKGPWAWFSPIESLGWCSRYQCSRETGGRGGGRWLETAVLKIPWWI